MATRKDSSIELVNGLPWQAGLVLGATGYAAVRYGLGWCISTFGGTISQSLGTTLADGTYAPIAWLLLGACWLAAFISFLDDRRRKHLLGTQSGLGRLSAMHWRDFEKRLSDAFQQQGYSVRGMGLGAVDGDVDMILHKDGAITLVQCRQWRTRMIDVRFVREMYGLLVHHRANALKIVAIGDYTDDAQRFVHGKPIELICGNTLLAMVQEGHTET